MKTITVKIGNATTQEQIEILQYHLGDGFLNIRIWGAPIGSSFDIWAECTDDRIETEQALLEEISARSVAALGTYTRR